MAFNLRRKKGQKYKNKEIIIGGIKFDSTKEGKRYLVLKDYETQGVISDLRLQVKFELIPAIKEDYIKHLKTKDKVMTRTLQLPINYICDFAYIKDGEEIIEDVKASPKILPTEFKLKEKLFFWKFRKHIRKVYKENEPI